MQYEFLTPSGTCAVPYPADDSRIVASLIEPATPTTDPEIDASAPTDLVLDRGGLLMWAEIGQG